MKELGGGMIRFSSEFTEAHSALEFTEAHSDLHAFSVVMVTFHMFVLQVSVGLFSNI